MRRSDLLLALQALAKNYTMHTIEVTQADVDRRMALMWENLPPPATSTTFKILKHRDTAPSSIKLMHNFRNSNGN
jgi:hypothetical protein